MDFDDFDDDDFAEFDTVDTVTERQEKLHVVEDIFVPKAEVVEEEENIEVKIWLMTTIVIMIVLHSFSDKWINWVSSFTNNKRLLKIILSCRFCHFAYFHQLFATFLLNIKYELDNQFTTVLNSKKNIVRPLDGVYHGSFHIRYIGQQYIDGRCNEKKRFRNAVTFGVKQIIGNTKQIFTFMSLVFEFQKNFYIPRCLLTQ